MCSSCAGSIVLVPSLGSTLSTDAFPLFSTTYLFKRIPATLPVTRDGTYFSKYTWSKGSSCFPCLSRPSSTVYFLFGFPGKIRRQANKHGISLNCLEHRCAAPPAHTYQQRQQIHELFRTCQHHILIASSKMKVQNDTFPWEIFEAIR